MRNKLHLTQPAALRALLQRGPAICSAVLAAVATSAVVAAAGAAPAFAQSSQAAAAAFVQQQRLGDSLRPLALTSAQRSEAFSAITAKLGPAEARIRLVRELDVLAPQFQQQWNVNLAEVYAQHFTPEELSSLAADGRKSRYFAKLASSQGQIGDEMQALSAPILTALVTRALGNISARIK